MLIENKNLESLFEKGSVTKEVDFRDASTSLQTLIVDFLNKHLPNMWPDDPFLTKVTAEGLCEDGWVVEYADHIEFAIDSDKYRICVAVVIKDNEAVLLDY